MIRVSLQRSVLFLGFEVPSVTNAIKLSCLTVIGTFNNTDSMKIQTPYPKETKLQIVPGKLSNSTDQLIRQLKEQQWQNRTLIPASYTEGAGFQSRLGYYSVFFCRFLFMYFDKCKY